MKIFFSSLILFLFSTKSIACAGGDIDAYFFQLLSQEIIDNPRYYPFLLTYYPGHYDDYSWQMNDQKKDWVQNQNLVAWQAFFDNKLSYDEVKSLIFDTKKEDFTAKGRKELVLLQKIPSELIDPVASYLYWAKTIEPYAVNNRWKSYNWETDQYEKIEDEILDYDKIISNLQRAYAAESQTALQQRYAYQMVRLAHYYQKYDEAVKFFETYAEPLKNTSEIYFYTLEQKAGALRALGHKKQANLDFLKVFANSQDRLKSAMSSVLIFDAKDLAELESALSTPQEKATLQMFLARQNFQNPLPYLKKIDEIHPNSPQSQVVWMRAINELERSVLTLSGTCESHLYYSENEQCTEHSGNRLPLYITSENNYFNQLINYAKSAYENQSGAFYQLTYAYLLFLQHDFDSAKKVLNHIRNANERQKEQITWLQMLIAVSEPETLDAAFEAAFYAKYKSKFEQIDPTNYQSYFWSNDAWQYIMDIMGNRYFNQQEYAKSFLCHNNIETLEAYQDMQVLEDLELFHHKKNKNNWEKHLLTFLNVPLNKIQHTISDVKGTYFVKHNQLEKALEVFQTLPNDYAITYYKYDYNAQDEWVKTPYQITGNEWNGYDGISNQIFLMNLKECFSCPADQVMNQSSLDGFDFITTSMNKKEVVKVLLKLQKIGNSKSKQASQALQLLGNFYYNITDMGYYRHIFHFQLSNANSYLFDEYHDSFSFHHPAPTFNYKIPLYTYDAFADTSIALNYYQKALEKSQNSEQSAEILYGMAKAESGMYHQWYENYFESHPDLSEWDKGVKSFLKDKRNQDYKNAFAQLQSNYSDTQMFQKIRQSCKYFQHYLKSNP